MLFAFPCSAVIPEQQARCIGSCWFRRCVWSSKPTEAVTPGVIASPFRLAFRSRSSLRCGSLAPWPLMLVDGRLRARRWFAESRPASGFGFTRAVGKGRRTARAAASDVSGPQLVRLSESNPRALIPSVSASCQAKTFETGGGLEIAATPFSALSNRARSAS